MIEIGEKATVNGTEAITQYGYDAVGNLTSVTDPTGGTTTMTYDAVNRLASRTMPNGVTTTYTYDEVDQVTSITHTTSTGTVLASFTYERDASGQPTTITREDGSYRELSYDASLRLTQEVFYDATSTAQETITYTYDAAGNRMAHSDSEGSHTYSYGDGFQLESVVNGTETDTYSHDVDGRLDAIAREGETLNLEHNAADQLTLVTNATTGETVTYTYDGDSNRIGETTGTGVRQYLVAPSMGSGLSVQDLVTDGAGNVLANHVYVGANPLMRLDGNGEAVYYLTDAMGSVIGLVDENGEVVAAFDYDGFGNARTTTGEDAVGEAIGGDYRFQSQWLESESGLYYMRARDYNAQTGRFMSRDPVDLIDTQPESLNPYQFAYNNPLVYSDPSGAITSIGEFNVGQVVQKNLEKIRNNYQAKISRKFIDEAQGVFTEVLTSAINSLLPFDPANALPGFELGGSAFETILRNSICNTIGNSFPQLLSNLWLEPGVDDQGNVFANGTSCGPSDDRFYPDRGRGSQERSVPRNRRRSFPDFIFRSSPPFDRDRPVTIPPAYLIGDFKLNSKKETLKIGGSQWKAILNYAQSSWSFNSAGQSGHQYVPIALYIVFNSTPGQVAKARRQAQIDGRIDLRMVSFFSKNK